MDYWKECIAEAFCEAGLEATNDQLETVVGWVEGAHENYGLATGLEVANANYISDEARELERIKREQEKRENWMLSTKPCKSCTTTGVVRDGWGRDMTCPTCSGEGRHR